MDKHTKLRIDIELLYDKWTREWANMIVEDIQPTRETMRIHLLELRKIIINNTDYSEIEDLINIACSE